MTVTSLIYGFSYPLLALVLERQGVDDTLIGLNTAAQGFAVFAVAPIASQIISRLGPARLMLLSVGLSLALFLLLPAFPNVYAWFLIRFLLGCANAFLWIAGEVWVNEMAEERRRGRIVGCTAPRSPRVSQSGLSCWRKPVAKVGRHFWYRPRSRHRPYPCCSRNRWRRPCRGERRPACDVLVARAGAMLAHRRGHRQCVDHVLAALRHHPWAGHLRST